jgi:hypothetical protein
VGSVDTQRALENGQVRDLYLTLAFIEAHAAAAESAARLAFERHALVEHVSGEAAERLDQAGGICARLRYATALEPVPIGETARMMVP